MYLIHASLAPHKIDCSKEESQNIMFAQGLHCLHLTIVIIVVVVVVFLEKNK